MDKKGVPFGVCKYALWYYVEQIICIIYNICNNGKDDCGLYCPKQKTKQTVEPAKHAQPYYPLYSLSYEVGKDHYKQEYCGKNDYVHYVLGNFKRKELLYLCRKGGCELECTPQSKQ